MTQKAAAKPTTTDESVQKAKRLFFTGLLDLSWRLALAILIPMLSGAFIDNKFDSGSVFTIAGMIIGFILSVWLIKSVVAKISKEIN